MKKLILISSILLPVSTMAIASEYQIPGEFSGTVGFVSEYSFRGIAQSNENPAVQASIDYSHDSGFYAGVWGSNVDLTDADIETDVYAGFSGEFGSGFAWDIGGIYYAYPGTADSLDYDFFEIATSLGYDFEVASVSAAVNYSPNNFADSGDATYVAGYVDVPLPYDLALNAHVGSQSIDDETAFGAPDYIDWGVGASYNFSGFDLSLNYIDTDLDTGECADGCAERVIFGVSRSFP